MLQRLRHWLGLPAPRRSDVPDEGWTRFRMSDGIAFEVHVPLSQFLPGWELAMAEDRLIEIVNPKGLRRSCNPHQIVYAENVDARVPAAQPAAAGSIR